jgi:sulfonate transport system ATP-binding protein
MTDQHRGIQVQTWDLTKEFAGISVLNSLNLEFKAGEFVVIVGRSGCGKSTLLRLVAGLETPSNGGVLLDQSPISQMSSRVRVMFQDARLLPWLRVAENVGLGLREGWRSQAHWALQQVGLEHRAKEYPAILSGGQRQRVALARALVSQPRLLLLDEPLGALDALTRLEMQGLIETLWQEQGFTALLVTHDVEEAIALADRVIVIAEGAIALDLTIDLPRPRPRGGVEFAALRETLLSQVMHKNSKISHINQELALA